MGEGGGGGADGLQLGQDLGVLDTKKGVHDWGGGKDLGTVGWMMAELVADGACACSKGDDGGDDVVRGAAEAELCVRCGR